jgi:hypothetical protein
VPSEQTRHVIDGYFTAMGSGQFDSFFTDDVTWTTVENHAVVQGRTAVQDFIVGLHAGMSDVQTRQLVIGDENAYIEGSCASINRQGERVLYCVAYDLEGTRIASMRAYGALAAFTPTESTA